jgi:hypothetical protein
MAASRLGFSRVSKIPVWRLRESWLFDPALMQAIYLRKIGWWAQLGSNK